MQVGEVVAYFATIRFSIIMGPEVQ